MIPFMKDMPLDPISVLDNFDTGSSGRPGDNSGGNRCADLGHRFRASTTACLQVVAVFRHANCSASGRPCGLPSGKTCSSPAALTSKLFAALVVVDAHTTVTRGVASGHDMMVARHDFTPDNSVPNDPMAALRRLGGPRNRIPRDQDSAKQDEHYPTFLVVHTDWGAILQPCKRNPSKPALNLQHVSSCFILWN
jgi:hypothetical protein